MKKFGMNKSTMKKSDIEEVNKADTNKANANNTETNKGARQTKKWAYSTSSKYFRGFLCMVAFCAFCAGVMLTIYAMGYYGEDIINNSPESFYDTQVYQNLLGNEMAEVLMYSDIQDEITDMNSDLAILDVSESVINTYSRELIEEDYSYGYFENNTYSIEDMEEYQIDSRQIEYDLSGYEETIEYLKTKDESSCEFDYLYFDTDDFKKLFAKAGVRNTDYRFSDRFSEQAYFVLENCELSESEIKNVEVKQSYSSDDEDVTEVELNEEVESTEITYNDNGQVVEEEAWDAENTGEDENVQMELVIEADSGTTYMTTAYVVYDPVEDIFYSTWDEYFSPMDTYIYDVEELRSVMEAMEESGKQYNSLLLPLLQCFNYTFGTIGEDNSFLYAQKEESEYFLDNCSSRGIYYFLQKDNDNYSSNVKTTQMMKDMERCYYFEKTSLDSITCSVYSKGTEYAVEVDELDKVTYDDSVVETFCYYPTGAKLYFAFEQSSHGLSQPSDLVYLNENYGWIHSNIIWIIILTAVSFLLLMLEAISLICTTGRRYKGDKEVSLNFYDMVFTEIWLLISIGIMAAAVFCGVAALDMVVDKNNIFVIEALTVLGCLPFGFSFMVLTLSFVRRIKARNFWKRSIVGIIIHGVAGKATEVQMDEVSKGRFAQLIRKVKNHICSIKGTTKLLIVFLVYVVMSVVSCTWAIDNSVNVGSLVYLFYWILQIVAIFVVIWVIKDIEKLTKGVTEITKGDLNYKVPINEKISVFRELADGINHIGDGLKNAVETSLKDERMKTELITNVSHDLKTPLTSIINYIDLLKKQEMPNDDAKHYIDVLDAKAQRLKQLTEDLVEAAKATSGNIELEMMPITFDELMKQALGEFEEKFEQRNLQVIATYPGEPAVIIADGRRLFRIIENVLQNIYKYALEGTRVYADLSVEEGTVTFILKNISALPLNISPDELMERFTRGDSARSTEGSGLGLSIAKDLTRLQSGEFEIRLDGDLFKVIIRFPQHT